MFHKTSEPGPIQNRIFWFDEVRKNFITESSEKVISLSTFKYLRVPPQNNSWRFDPLTVKLRSRKVILDSELTFSKENLNRSLRSFCRNSGIESTVYSRKKFRFHSELRFLLNSIYFYRILPVKFFRLFQKSVCLFLAFSDKWKVLFKELKRMFSHYIGKYWPSLFENLTVLRTSAYG